MFEGLLEKILQRLFGEYIANLDQENLHIGVLSFFCDFSKNLPFIKGVVWKCPTRQCVSEENHLESTQAAFFLKVRQNSALECLVSFRRRKTNL